MTRDPGKESHYKVFERLRVWSDAAAITLKPAHKLEIEKDVLRYITWLTANNKWSTANSMQEFVDTVASTQYRHGQRVIDSLQSLMISEGPGHWSNKLVIRRQRKAYDKRAVTPEQFAIMLSVVATTSGKPDRDLRLMMYLMWYCGLAMIDACNVRWNNINLEHRVVIGGRSKSGSQFTVPLLPGEPLLALLEEYHSERDSDSRPTDLVSVRLADFYAVSRQMIVRRFTLAGRAAGLPPGNGAHAIRRAFVTRLISSGVSDTVVSQMSGHTDTGSLKQYHKPSLQSLRAALEKAHDAPSSSGHAHPPGLPDPRTSPGAQAPGDAGE